MAREHATEESESMKNHALALLVLTATTGAHAWRVIPISGGFDGGYTMTEKAKAPIKTWLRAEHPTLNFQCDKKGTTLWLEVSNRLAYSGVFHRSRVRYRFDGGKIISELWHDAVNHGAFGSPSVVRMLSGMRNAKTVEFEVTPHNSGSVSFAFDLSDFNAAHEDFKKSCKR